MFRARHLPERRIGHTLRELSRCLSVRGGGGFADGLQHETKDWVVGSGG